MKTEKQDCEIISFENNLLIVRINKPKSLLNLLKEYGKGKRGFDEKYIEKDNLPSRPFARHVPKKETYEIDVKNRLVKLKSEKDGKTWNTNHLPILSHAILEYLKTTESQLVEDAVSPIRYLFNSRAESFLLSGTDSEGLDIGCYFDAFKSPIIRGAIHM